MTNDERCFHDIYNDNRDGINDRGSYSERGAEAPREGRVRYVGFAVKPR